MSLEKELSAKAQIARQSSGLTNPIAMDIHERQKSPATSSGWGILRKLQRVVELIRFSPRAILSVQGLLSENHQRMLEIKDLRADVAKYAAEIQSLRATLARPEGDVGARRVESNSINPIWSNYYRAFEDRFRGSPEQIAGKQSRYVRIVEEHLKSGAKVVDLGCGRGEWLKLLAKRGFEVCGVDSNEAMLQEAAARGVKTVQSDIFTWLAGQADASADLISAFHVIEHLTAQQMLQLAAEAVRILRRGGLIILETPNPENIQVGSCNFWTDITHQKPIPPSTLGFLLEFMGFEQIDCVRSGESEVPHEALRGLFAPPDYAIISRKK
jgi:2-polyprenyl-3-methyl-5-hydroxy-6-metoxy-1,4-benzoquinol methylase